MDPSGLIGELQARRQALYEASYTLPFSLDDELPQRGEAGNQFVKRCGEWHSFVEAAIQAGLKLFERRISDQRVDVIGSLIYLKELIGKPILEAQLEEVVASHGDVDLASLIKCPAYQAVRACIQLQRKAMNVVDALAKAIDRLGSVFLPRLRLGKELPRSRRELHVEIAGHREPPRSIRSTTERALVALRKGPHDFGTSEYVKRFRSDVPELGPYLIKVPTKDGGQRTYRLPDALRARIG